MINDRATCHFDIEGDLTFQHLLSQGLSHCRLEMTDSDPLETQLEATPPIHESETNA